MKTIIRLQCPNCMADLEGEINREVMFCQYCGTKILLNDENTFTYRHVDEAKIKESENNKIVRMRELELEEQRIKNRTKSKRTGTIIWNIAILFLLFWGILGAVGGEDDLIICLLLGVGCLVLKSMIYK